MCGVQSLDSSSMDEWIRDGHDLYCITFNGPKKKELTLHTVYLIIDKSPNFEIFCTVSLNCYTQ